MGFIFLQVLDSIKVKMAWTLGRNLKPKCDSVVQDCILSTFKVEYFGD